MAAFLALLRFFLLSSIPPLFQIALMLAVFSFPLTACRAEEEQTRIQEILEEQPLRSLPFLVVDLDGDGIELIPLEESNVYFDVDGDGLAERTAWVKPDDGFITLTPNLFYREDIPAERMFVRTMTQGLKGLFAFDTSGDNILDDNDQAAFKISYWQDKNFDTWRQWQKEASPNAFRGIYQVFLPKKNKKELVEKIGVINAESFFTTHGENTFPFKEIQFFYEDTNAKVEKKEP